ncbi:MAG: lactate utilization protein C, partial [Alphaproteobacteria bacterium]|nr:lactate utilization protein C [Alphaproteobacteria bacterium]
AARHGLAPRCRRAGGALLDSIAWANAPDLAVVEGAAEDADRIGITAPAFGVAETGTLVLASAPHSPTSPAYLPEAHVAVIRRDAVVATYDDAWAALAAHPDFPPRVVAWITGPSRTADIEQTILLGVHGPRLQHIVILDGDG